MNIPKASFYLAATFVLYGCAVRDATEGWKKTTVGDVIQLRIPPSYLVTERRPMGDVVLIGIKDGDRQVVSAYIGNHPAFPSDQAAGAERYKTINGNKAERASGKPGTSDAEEILIHLDGAQMWPSYVHFRIDQGDVSQVAVARDIIASMHYIGGGPPGSGPPKDRSNPAGK